LLINVQNFTLIGRRISGDLALNEKIVAKHKQSRNMGQRPT